MKEQQCEMHEALMAEFAGADKIKVESGHPIDIMQCENNALINLYNELQENLGSDDVENVIANVKKYAGWIGEFIILAGDFEMEALASGAIRALNGEEELLEYTGVPVWTHFDFEPADE